MCRGRRGRVMAGDFPELLTQAQAARYLGIGVRSVARMMAAGELPVRSVGRDLRIVRRALDRMNEAQRPEREATLALLRRRAG